MAIVLPAIFEYSSYKIENILLFVIQLTIYIIIPLITKGYTIGKKIVSIRISNIDGQRAKVNQILIRQILLFAYLEIIFLISAMSDSIYSIALLLFIGFSIYQGIRLIRNKPLFYELLTKTKNQSVITLR